MKASLRLTAPVVFAVLLTVFPAPAPAGVSVGHSGWTWGDPSPQGNAIATLEFVGGRGYAAGGFGTLLRTDNAGASWIGIPTGIRQPIKRIRIIDGDSLVIAGGCALRRSDDAGQSFTRLPWTASEVNCSDEITSFAFPTDQIGYILTTQRNVFRTANGGRTWARKTTVPAGPPLAGSSSSPDIAFTAPDVGIALSNGQIYRTTDGGGSWKLVASHSNGLNGLFFIGATGYAVGSGTSLLKSADGGATWEVKSAGGALTLNSIRCADASTCLATTLTSGAPGVAPSPVVLRTTDGGTSFAAISPSTYGIGAAAFATPTRAVAAGEKGATVVSDDAGATWSSVGGTLGETFTRLRATSPALAFATGEKGALARTTDGGGTWTKLSVSTSGDVVDTSFVSPAVGYALDSTGAALKTDDAAASWQILNTGTTATPNALVALDANQVLLIGPTGLRRSTNGGGEFSGVKGKASRSARLSDYDRAGSSIFAYGAKALISSTDNGNSWKKVKRPPRASLGTVDFVSKRVGFAVTTKGALWQTGNGGRNWRRLLGTGYAHPGSDAFDVSFSSARSGWFVANLFGEAGHALRTSDGGKTWRPQVVSETPVFDIVATGDKTGLLHTYGGQNLFATTSGGDAGTPTTLKVKASKRQVKRRTRVKVTGKLTPAEGAERVTVSAFDGRRWRKSTETVASNGTFTTTWRVSRTSYFVAQWAGDDDRAGDGTKVLVVKVRKGRR